MGLMSFHVTMSFLAWALPTPQRCFKAQMQTGFSEIKLLISAQNNAKVVQTIATFGTIGAAILACVGYIIVKL